MKRTPMSLDTCMDIFDWFDAPEFDWLMHIYLSKLDGEERLKRVLPQLRWKARKLVNAHRGCEDAYPEELSA